VSRRRLAKTLALAALVVGIAWTLSHRAALDASALAASLDGLGAWAAPAFVAVYAVGALLFLPGSALTLTGGALFGPVAGAALSLAGATVGAALAFLIARATGGEWVERRLSGRLAELVRGVEDDGWRFVAFVRLVPLFPFNLLNYALGLTRISLGTYVVASALCMVPGAAAYSYLGHAGREVMTGTTGSALRAGLLGLALLGGALFLLPRVARRLRSATPVAPRTRGQEV